MVVVVVEEVIKNCSRLVCCVEAPIPCADVLRRFEADEVGRYIVGTVVEGNSNDDDDVENVNPATLLRNRRSGSSNKDNNQSIVVAEWLFFRIRCVNGV